MVRIMYDEDGREMVVTMSDIKDELGAVRACAAIVNGLALEVRTLFGREAMERMLTLIVRMDAAGLIGFVGEEDADEGRNSEGKRGAGTDCPEGLQVRTAQEPGTEDAGRSGESGG